MIALVRLCKWAESSPSLYETHNPDVDLYVEQVRSFCCSDDLENQTRFVWDGSHLLQEVQQDGRYTYIHTNPSR